MPSFFVLFLSLFGSCLVFFFSSPEHIFWFFLRVLICSSLCWSVSGLSAVTCSSFQLAFLIPLLIAQPNRRPLQNLFFNRKLKKKKKFHSSACCLVLCKGKVGDINMQQTGEWDHFRYNIDPVKLLVGRDP